MERESPSIESAPAPLNSPIPVSQTSMQVQLDTSSNTAPTPISESTPTVSTEQQTHARRQSRAEIARQVLDAYRAEPVSPPPLAAASTTTITTTVTVTGGTPTPSTLPGRNERRSRSGDYSLLVPRGSIESPGPQKAGQTRAVPGPSRLSCPPLTTAALSSPSTPTATAASNNEFENYLRTLQTKTEPSKKAVEEYEYRRIPVSGPQSPLRRPPSLPKQTPPIHITQRAQTPSSPGPPNPQTPRLGIIEEKSRPEFTVSPTSPRIVFTTPEGLAVRPVRRSRAFSDGVPADIVKAKLKEQQRKEHLVHGTWQQGRFRPPWDELTVINSGNTVVEDNPAPKRQPLDAISHDQRLESSRPVEPSRLDSNRASLDMNRRESLDKYNNPRDHHEMQEFLEQYNGEDLLDMAELQGLLPPGFPGTLKLYYQLEVLAEHYFDTLQPDMAIYIYTTYFIPPPGTPGVTYSPRAATWFTLGQIYLSTHSFLSALRSFERAIQCDPFEVASHVQVGYVCFLLERYKEAKEAYSAALNGFRDAAKINYQVLGLDAFIRKEDVIQSIKTCEQGGLGSGTWGIGSGKVYRVPEEKKRNIARRRYFDQGKVVGRAVEVSKIRGGKGKVLQVEEDDYDTAGGGLEKVKTNKPSVWNVRSPVPTISGRSRRSLDSARLEELEIAPTISRATTRWSLDTARLGELVGVSALDKTPARRSVDTARLETPRSSTELVASRKAKGKSHRTNSGLGYFLQVLGWR
ncbi:hypothetical protein L211DRAFT_888327 [Terfezia boudieri ATCC MYA-4762]|uniref:Uncharacterized protein n=1 Tax=Terfezia boudieri ATCC MYA-4762 TaxID=1051890 RepID=A0A3N4LMF6_9PEZI|nr:hypothetical protein L211DRAFT_888327 [Terfezia boudieri ATCC MYA-4762]